MNKLSAPVIRLFRYFRKRCICCGKNLNSYYESGIRYCGLECYHYDNGCRPENKSITKNPVYCLFFGYTDNYKNHFKYKDKYL
jgi:hypothetical protein